MIAGDCLVFWTSNNWSSKNMIEFCFRRDAGHFYLGIWWLFFWPLKNIYSGGSHLSGKDNGQISGSNISVFGDDSLLRKVHLFVILAWGKERNPVRVDHRSTNYTLCAKPVHCPFLYTVCEFKSVVYIFKPLTKSSIFYGDSWNLYKIKNFN